MKKLLISALLLGSLVAVVPSVEAKPAKGSMSVEPQITVRIGPQRQRGWNRRIRTVTTTRLTRIGRMRFREPFERPIGPMAGSQARSLTANGSVGTVNKEEQPEKEAGFIVSPFFCRRFL
jgi:hypothetical protein